MVRLVLAGSDLADLGRARNILASKGVVDVSVCERESQVLQTLQQCPLQGLATVIIAQQVSCRVLPTAAELSTRQVAWAVSLSGVARR